jgi:hypothetical protein
MVWFARTAMRGRRVGSGGDEGKLAEHLLAGLLEGGAGFVAAAAAAVGTTGAGLQFGKSLHAIRCLAADVVVGDGVAQADVHGTYENANANDCQQLNNLTTGGPSGRAV